MTTPRKNAELAINYFSDDTQRAWIWSLGNGRWIEIRDPAFRDDCTYHVGHEAPSEPPIRTCTLAGMEYPQPLQKMPEYGTAYWMAGAGGAISCTGFADRSDQRWFALGLCHLTKEAAEAQSRAIQAAVKAANEGAK